MISDAFASPVNNEREEGGAKSGIMVKRFIGGFADFCNVLIIEGLDAEKTLDCNVLFFKLKSKNAEEIADE